MNLNNQLDFEHNQILSRRPSYIRVSIFSWIVWSISIFLGLMFLFVGLANLVTGSITMEILLEIIENKDAIKALGTDGTQTFIYLISIGCFFIAIPFLFVAWLAKAIIKRNIFIADQIEFTEKLLIEHKAIEHSLGVVQHTFSK